MSQTSSSEETVSIALSQYLISQATDVVSDVNYALSQCSLEADSETAKNIFAFGTALVDAIDAHPEADSNKALKMAISSKLDSYSLEVPEDVLIDYLDALSDLDSNMSVSPRPSFLEMQELLLESHPELEDQIQ